MGCASDRRGSPQRNECKKLWPIVARKIDIFAFFENSKITQKRKGQRGHGLTLECDLETHEPMETNHPAN